ncbi:DNA-processing protein DprA [Microbacterium kribbense]|uniref:DNA-processing protein DprA n=1 Tax=Microbacterium kribbense TaxID=433645 RepID=A0ABP7GTZ6_9MICO
MTAFRWDESNATAVAALVGADAAADEQRLQRAYAAAVWSCLVEPGDGVAGRLIAALGPDEALREVIGGARGGLAADAAEVDADDMHQALARWRPRLEADAIALALGVARGRGIQLVVPDDPGWPATLNDLGEHAPVCLWVRGNAAALAHADPAIAIVGARAATGYGEHIAGEFAAELAGRGVTVVSGAAYGIDGAAHRGALSAGGVTVAMLAGGVDRPYPAGHTQLLERIAVTGAVASEVPCGSAPTKWRFLQRNRLIAALGRATVVVEAGWRSGSLNTAAHAADLGRPLGAVPGPVTSGSSAGCHRMLREFDACCVTTADEAAELVGLDRPPVDATLDLGPAWNGTDERSRVIDALSTRAARGIDDIARRCGMAPGEVRVQLGMLALEGTAQSQSDRWRRVAVGAGR